MFVPRALRLKGVKEPKKDEGEPPAKKRRVEPPPAHSQTTEKATTSSKTTDRRSAEHGAQPSTTSSTPSAEYLGFLTSGFELLFTDYAMQSEAGDAWLRKHYRTLDGTPGTVPCEPGTRPDSIDDGMYIHLSAILEHPNISSLKPTATQPLLQQALRERPSLYLELSEDGYFVRRKPSTYPIKSIPSAAFDDVDDNGVPFWDRRAIYIEPHTRDLCKTPAKVAYWLKQHGGLRERWLPVQAVTFLYNSCAFVTLSGDVTIEDMWAKWRAARKPEWWKIMTKMEHTKRTNEYVDLLWKEQAGRGNARKQDSKALPEQTATETAEVPPEAAKKKKKKRGKTTKTTVVEGETAPSTGSMAQSDGGHKAAAVDTTSDATVADSKAERVSRPGGHIRFDD